MKGKLQYYFVVLFLLLHIALDQVGASCKAIYIFGDSTFDAGNNHFIKNCSIQADFLPYGRDFFHRPTGRFTNGRTVVDFIAHYMGVELQKPYLQIEEEMRRGLSKTSPCNGINFASAGSGLLSDTNKNMSVISIQTQLQQFKALVNTNKIIKGDLKTAIFVLEAGSNDINRYFDPLLAPNLTAPDLVNAMVNEVATLLEEVYELDGRRFALLGIGPVGCVLGHILLPNAQPSKCNDYMNKLVKVFNQKLEMMVLSIPSKLPGVMVTYGAVYDIVQSLMASPRHYGFKDIWSACCGSGALRAVGPMWEVKGLQGCSNPNEFLFWDFFHPTERTYKIIAKGLWGGG